jgi:hypothetical protein
MRLKEKVLTGLLLMPLAGTSAWAKEGVNYDAFLASPDAKSLPATEAQLLARGARVEHMEERLGLPTVLWNAQPDTQRSSTLAGLRPEQAARTHLQKFADVYRLTSEDIAGATLQSVHKTAFGPVIARFGQKVEGIEVFRSGVNVVMDRNHNLVAITGYLTPHEAVAARRATVGSDFRLSAADAIALAFKDMTDTAISGRSLVSTGTQADYTHFAFAPGVAAVMPHAMASPARAKPVYFILPNGLQPAYYLELNVGTKSSKDSDYYSFVISATDGSVLSRNNLTADEAFTYRVWASPTSFIPFDGPQGDNPTPHPTGNPDRYQAPFIPANLVTLQNHPFSRNDPWLPNGATQTTGNNVDAYADLAAPDGFQPEVDLRPGTTSPGVFDYTYDVTRSPASADQRKATTAHLFYVNNFLHDWYYDAGFDEASGNAQTLNYGRGGLEGDSIKAEAQDYSGRNNANMSTPSDGARPRMQMYVFDGVPVMRTLSPPSVVNNHETGTGAFGNSNYDLTGELKILDPAGSTYACEAFPAGTFTGKIAVVDRGPLVGTACGFTVKALFAQQAGAIAVIIANHTANQPAPGMGGTDPAITVPVLSVPKETADAWKAEVRTNNSTISVRMQRNPNLDRDGTIDNQIVAHEWGHYISNRLVGNSNGLSNVQGRGMGEGWADFHAMLMTVREEDRNVPSNSNYQGVYAMAGYTQSGGANNGYYFGIRRVPYSTNMQKNGLTFRHTANGNPLPNHPVAGGATGVGNSQVHATGEVWNTMLWECYASLLNAYPFQEAQDRMKQYLVAAYKATPLQPTILEARDAILAAAAASDPADYTRFVQAFAKRGAGHGAKAANRSAVDNVGAVESFAAGNNLETVSIRLDDSGTGCDSDGVLDVGEAGLLLVTVRNSGGAALPSFTGTVSTSGASATLAFPGGNTLSFPALQRGQSHTSRLPVQLNAVTGTTPRAGLTITYNEPSLPSSAATATFNERVHYDEVLSSSAADNFEASVTSWTSTNTYPLTGFEPTTDRNADGTFNRYFHAPDHGVVSDTILTSPWIRVNPAGDFILTYKVRHSLEGTPGGTGMAAPFYDGVVLEVTTNGTTWTDVFAAPYNKNPGYAAILATGNNPLSARPAFVGTNATTNPVTAFPGWSNLGVNFGTLLAGQNVRFRFRVGTDSEASAYGFDLDDVAVTNVTGMPFGSIVPETSDGTTCNRRPVADPGLPRSVNERDATGNLQMVTLNGTASFDPDGQALTYMWTQVSGPTVTLSDATSATPTFTANVNANTVLTFQLIVSDGVDSSTPKQVAITILNSNRKPVAVPSGPASVAERSAPTVQLSATGSTDADGETLTYTWTQTAGPTVTMTGATTATMSFPTPEVTANTAYTFRLVATDGTTPSDPATFTVTVTNVDRRPRANAGEDRMVEGRTPVSVSGTATDDDNDAITYAWTQDPADVVMVEATGADTNTLSFVSPDVKQPAVLHFTLTATANGETSSDTVDIMVRPDRSPAVNAGVDQMVNGRAPVSLYGSASDPENDSITYVWAQSATDVPQVTLTGANTATPSFMSPDVKMETVLHFTLTVTANGLTTADEVSVTVRADGMPVANAGTDRAVNAREAVSLEGFGSDPDGDAVTYAWTQVDGPTVELTGATTATPSFNAPDVRNPTTLTFKLTVTANGLTAEDTVSITVRKFNRRPVGRGPAAFEEREGTAIMLDASTSTDPDGDALSYRWTQTGGPQVQVTGQDTNKLQFTAPEVASDTMLAFTLVVSDPDGAQSEVLSVSVKVLNVNKQPAAQARKLGNSASGETVTLDASLSKDLDGEQLTYKWEQTDGPAVTLSSDKEPTVTFQAPTTTTNMTLTFKVTVTDTHGASASQEVQVEVTGVKDENEGGGCASTGTSSGSAMLLALLAGVLLSRRRITLRA